VIGDVRQPILAVWGDVDSFTPLVGPTGRLFQRLAAERANVELVVVSAGHVPHDDNPRAVRDALIPFLRAHWPPLAASSAVAAADGCAGVVDSGDRRRSDGGVGAMPSAISDPDDDAS
jgi:hypothetical protein